MWNKFALRKRARNGYLGGVTIEIPNSVDLEGLALARRSGWPEDLRILVAT
jgi:hypothetical protein